MYHKRGGAYSILNNSPIITLIIIRQELFFSSLHNEKKKEGKTQFLFLSRITIIIYVLITKHTVNNSSLQYVSIRRQTYFFFCFISMVWIYVYRGINVCGREHERIKEEVNKKEREKKGRGEGEEKSRGQMREKKQTYEECTKKKQ